MTRMSIHRSRAVDAVLEWVDAQKEGARDSHTMWDKVISCTGDKICYQRDALTDAMMTLHKRNDLTSEKLDILIRRRAVLIT